jgi:2',3'-cyclic-nucleotide 2'-phosphodiesterase
MNRVRILCIGDVVGATGCAMFQRHVPRMKKERSVDLVIVNGENSASDGRGTTARVVHAFRHNGADVVTSGNHIWAKREIYAYLDENTDLIRPVNYPQGVPGVGFTLVHTVRGHTVAVANVQGRVFMREQVADPFRAADSMLTFLKSKTSLIVVDFHAETTSEKHAFGYYLDGRVSAVFGTHTHVQTADERILPKGTAFMTDLGMTGSLNSMLGMKKESVMRNFLLQLPSKFEVDTSLPLIMSGLLIDIDTDTGLAVAVERIRVEDNELVVTEERAAPSTGASS